MNLRLKTAFQPVRGYPGPSSRVSEQDVDGITLVALAIIVFHIVEYAGD